MVMKLRASTPDNPCPDGTTQCPFDVTDTSTPVQAPAPVLAPAVPPPAPAAVLGVTPPTQPSAPRPAANWADYTPQVPGCESGQCTPGVVSSGVRGMQGLSRDMQYDMYNAGRLTPYTYQNAMQQDADMNGRIVRSMQDTPQFSQDVQEAQRQGMTPGESMSYARQRAASGMGNLMPYAQDKLYGTDETILNNAAKQAAGAAMLMQSPETLQRYTDTLPGMGTRINTPVPFVDPSNSMINVLVRQQDGRMVRLPLPDTQQKDQKLLGALTEGLHGSNPLGAISAMYKKNAADLAAQEKRNQDGALKLALGGQTIVARAGQGTRAAEIKAGQAAKPKPLNPLDRARIAEAVSRANKNDPKNPVRYDEVSGKIVPVTPVTAQTAKP